MRLYLKKIDSFTSESVKVRRELLPCFDEQWHFHEELELIYIIKGRGMRFVGDNIGEFAEGELVLNGPNLPHLWRNDPEYYQKMENASVEAIIIQFKKDFLGETFLNKNECSSINQLFEQSLKGILFQGKNAEKAKQLIQKLPDFDGMKRLIKTLEILDLLASSQDYKLLSKPYQKNEFRQEENDRLDAVGKYILNNIQEEIKLKDVAEVAYMTPNAFCRFFKKRTGKTLSIFINEIRISYSCKMLQSKNTNISLVANKCGYTSLTYFNRQFKKIMAMTPKEYRGRHF